MADIATIRVDGDPGYDVVIGHDVVRMLPSLMTGGVERAAVIHSRELAGVVGDVTAMLRACDVQVTSIEVPDAEAAKTADVAASCWARLGAAGFTRSDAVVGVGGGAVTDLAGFVAATWMRGIRSVLVPTSLLAMVDAAIGGKTGINTAAGKNLVGTFHSPAGVLCDLHLLATLGPAEFVSGLAEVVKAGLIADPVILELIEADPRSAVAADGAVTAELVERSVRVKAAVVGRDPRESHDREVLNYGHTFGHAIEAVEGYAWRHGDAVSVGMVFAAELGHAAGRTDADLVDRHRLVLASLGLPTSYRGDRWPMLLQAMAVDKKARGSRLRFVVLDGLARPGRLEAVDPDVLLQAYARVSRDSKP